jgi:uncharacterized protein (DUF4415 family)
VIAPACPRERRQHALGKSAREEAICQPLKRKSLTRLVAAVSDNPEWTDEDFARARPFTEVFPQLAKSIRRGRGPNKAPTKKLVSLRLSPEVVEHFKSQGPGWQSRIDDTLRKAAKLKAGQVQNRKRARRR